MGRFAVSLFAISIVLTTVPEELLPGVFAQGPGELRAGDTTAAVGGVAEGSSGGVSQEIAGSSGSEDSSGSRPAETDRGALANPVKGTGSQGFFESFLNNPLNLILLMFVALYVVLLLLPKPGRKEQKALEERLANLKKNDRVVLSSGIHGIVANINAEAGTITLRVDEGSNAKITVDRSAIRSVEA
ncbi:MAG: preprotein translocase subunit YajC [Planctomycetes bacterium]|nr:preprotein translocase subunit YajC [Planctomycetota bacterium]